MTADSRPSIPMILMIKQFRVLIFLALALGLTGSLRAEAWLGDAPTAPTSASALPARTIKLLTATGGFNVDTSPREQVRSFYNAVYRASDGVGIGSTADIATCTPGTNSPVFQDAVLRRINWFRAMAGLPAAVTFSASENVQCQAAALMMSANTNLQHTGIPPTWHCFSTTGTNAAANSNLALGYNGPDAVTGYIWDFGGNNAAAGHRRWILYPQTQVMATGDVPAQNNYFAANATWILDANYAGPRPATRTDFVAWPPAGYVPAPVVYPRWSFSLTNVDFSAATVNLKSNGVNVAVAIEPLVSGYPFGGIGENTLVWHPTGLDPTSATTLFPFSGTDTVYSVIVSNVITGEGLRNYSYTVTVFDPTVPGADFFPPVISGTNKPTVNANNAYTCRPVPDPNVTGYEWLVSQTTNGNFFDGAEGTLTNFTVTASAGYSVITNLTGQTGSHCFYMAMPDTVDQTLQLNRVFLPATNTTVQFKSQLGYATTNQIIKVQVTTNTGTDWKDLYSQIGSGGSGETSFTAKSLSLSNYAGMPVQIRFKYVFSPNGDGAIFNQVLTSPPVGWFFDNLAVTNTSALFNLVTNATTSTNFNFFPTQATNYNLQARALIFDQFTLDWGPLKTVSAVTNPPTILLATPIIIGSQVQLDFTVSGGPVATFRLLSVNQLGQVWTTNSGAVLTTNVPGSAYRFTTTNGPVTRFYRIQTP